MAYKKKTNEDYITFTDDSLQAEGVKNCKCKDTRLVKIFESELFKASELKKIFAENHEENLHYKKPADGNSLKKELESLIKKSKDKIGGEQKVSYITRTKNAVLKNVNVAKSKEEFIALMQADGISTDWRTNKEGGEKEIIFTDEEQTETGKEFKVSNKNLFDYFNIDVFKSENLLAAFENNLKKIKKEEPKKQSVSLTAPSTSINKEKKDEVQKPVERNKSEFQRNEQKPNTSHSQRSLPTVKKVNVETMQHKDPEKTMVKQPVISAEQQRQKSESILNQIKQIQEEPLTEEYDENGLLISNKQEQNKRVNELLEKLPKRKINPKEFVQRQIENFNSEIMFERITKGRNADQLKLWYENDYQTIKQEWQEKAFIFEVQPNYDYYQKVWTNYERHNSVFNLAELEKITMAIQQLNPYPVVVSPEVRANAIKPDFSIENRKAARIIINIYVEKERQNIGMQSVNFWDKIKRGMTNFLENNVLAAPWRCIKKVAERIRGLFKPKTTVENVQSYVRRVRRF